MIKVYENSWQLIRKNFLNLLLFEFMYRVGTFLIITRLFEFGVSISLQRNDYSYLTAENFTAFLKNPITLFFILITGILALFFLLIEVSTVFVCFQFSHNRKKLMMTDMLLMGIKRTFDFLKESRVTWILCVLFSVPFLCMHFLVREIYYMKVLNYTAIKIYESFPYKWLLFTIIAIFFFLSLLFVFTLPYCLLEGKKSFHGMVESVKLLVRNFSRTWGGLIAVNALITVILFALYAIALFIAGIYVYLTKDPSIAIGAVLAISEWVEMSIGLVGGAIGLVGNLAFIYNLYLHYVNEYHPKTIPLEEWDKHLLISDGKKRAAAVVVGLLLIVLEFVYVGDTFLKSDRIAQNIIESTGITAHRGGVFLAPENTMLALEKSVEAMVDYAEIDVQMTQDSKVVLLHDNSIKRVTGVNSNIWDVDYRDIKDIPVRSKSKEDEPVQYIPLLEEVLEYCKGRLNLNIEIKYNGRNSDIVDLVLDIIEEYGFEDQCMISSMNYNFITQVKEKKPEIQTGYIMTMTYGSIANIQNADFLSVKWSYINENFIREAHENGKQVHAWTVNYRGTVERMKSLAVDNIITDNPGLVKEVLVAENRKTTFIELLRYVFR